MTAPSLGDQPSPVAQGEAIDHVAIAIDEDIGEAPLPTEGDQRGQIFRQAGCARLVSRPGWNEPAMDGGGNIERAIARGPGRPKVQQLSRCGGKMRGGKDAVAAMFERWLAC